MSERADRRGGAAPHLSRRAFAVLLAAAGVAALLALFAIVRPRAARTSAPDESSPARVTVPSASLRQRPSADAPVVDRLARGAKIRVLSMERQWAEVRTDKGANGFLSVQELERDSDRQAREKRARTILGYPPLYGVVADDCEVLLAPFPLAPRSGPLHKGATVRVHSVDHAYYAIRTEDGELGFVESSRVDLVPPDPREPAIAPAADVKPLKNLTVTNLALPSTTEEPSDAERLAEEAGRPGVSDEPPTEAAVLETKIDPVYPESARRAGVDGTVVLEAIIGADGRVTSVRVESGQPFGLSEAAVDAVRRWRYRPARGPAGPVASRKQVRILFRLGR